MILHDSRYKSAAAAIFLGVVALTMLLLHGMAHAAGADPIATVAAGGDTAVAVWQQDGPLWAGLLVAMYALRAFLNADHALAKGRVLSVLTGAAMVGAAALQWKLNGAPFEGILTALFAAAALIQHPTVQPTPARASEAGYARLTMMVVIAYVAVVFSAAITMTSCSSWRARTAAGVGAFLSCESPHVDAQLLEEAKTVSIAGIEKWISGDGHVDKAGLKTAAAPLRSDLMRCAFLGAVAAIAEPKPKSAAQVAGLEVDGAELRATAAQVTAELGWPAQAVVK